MNLLSFYSAFILCFQREELAMLRCQKEMNQVSYIIWYDMKDTVQSMSFVIMKVKQNAPWPQFVV